MRISIDSAEPLEDVMRVVGALYDVTLTVAATDGAAEVGPPAGVRGRGAGRAAGAKKARGGGSRGRGRSATRLPKVTNGELRAWARENGHTVSDRGRIPAAVAAAYREAHGD